MADRASLANDSGSPPPPPLPPQQDWEVLSLSMSASAFGTSESDPSAVDSPATSGYGNTQASTAMAEGNSETVNQSEGAVKVSEPDLPLGSWKTASSELRVGDVKEKGKRLASNSEADSFAEEWKALRGTVPSDVIMDTLPVEFDGFHTVSERVLLTASEDPFERVGKESNVEEGLKKEESGHGIVEGTGGLKNKSNVQGQKVTEKSLCSFCKDGFSATWEKWQASVLQLHTPESGTLWSIALAAAVMGLVVIGYRWQRERSQNQQLRMQLSAKDEKVNDLLHQVNRLREVMTGRRRVPVAARLSSGYGLIGDQ